MNDPVRTEAFRICVDKLEQDIMTNLSEISNELWRSVMLQRESILRAFVAETGCKPSEAIQVEQRLDNGLSTWYVRKKNESDLKREQEAVQQP